jgi:hypothetical protein
LPPAPSKSANAAAKPRCPGKYGAVDKPLLHLWAENCKVTRRVVGIADQSPDRIMLSVERFGRNAPERMEIVRLSYKRSAKVISREGFCGQLRS